MIEWRYAAQPLAYLDTQFSRAKRDALFGFCRNTSNRFAALDESQDTVVFFSDRAASNARARRTRRVKTLRARGVSEDHAQYQASSRDSRTRVEWAGFYRDAREVAGAG